MRIERLSLVNFRGFQKLDLEFSATVQTTALVGINGAGKTSVIDALAILLSHYLASRHSHISRKELSGHDIRIGQLGCRITIAASHDDEVYSWSAEKGLAPPVQAPRKRADASSLRLPGGFDVDPSDPNVDPDNIEAVYRNRDEDIEYRADDILIAPTVDPPPIVAYYPVERTVGRFEDETVRRPLFDSGSKYEDLLTDTSKNYTMFLNWFMARENIENEEIRSQADFRDNQLEAVRKAISRFLPQFQGVRVRRPRGRREVVSNVFVVDEATLLVNKEGLTFTLEQLSHGERGLLALTGDIARRLAMAFPKSDSPCTGPGIVLIDEVCLHLHPQWQQEVIPRLEGTFPNVQFIITTHSPQVLAQIRPEGVKILREFTSSQDELYTHGRDTNSILGAIMDVSARPAFAEARLHSIAQLIDREMWAEAQHELDDLSGDFGPVDAEVMRLRALIDFWKE